MGTDIVLATGNAHKVEEMSAILAGLGYRGKLLRLDEVGGPFAEPVEHGSTFEANATIKALGYAGCTGRICLADDSGLEVDALGGRPGVISSHYCTDGVEQGMTRAERDRRNNERVLRELEGVDEARRGARFVCVMVLAGPSGVLATCRGSFEGRIGVRPMVPRGEGGFGYDPLFLVAPGYLKTSAELSAGEKNRLSHRGRAAEAVMRFLRATPGA